MWIKQLKIAIVEKNIEKINELMDDIPQLESKEDVDSAITLLSEATSLLTSLKDSTQASMLQMQKNIKFLKVTDNKKPSTLDITS